MEQRSLRMGLCLRSRQQTGINKLCQRSTKLWQHLRPGMGPLFRPRDQPLQASSAQYTQHSFGAAEAHLTGPWLLPDQPPTLP